MLIKMSVEDFIKEAASDAPTPGGGGIAALVGALGASMASMAANFTVGRPKFAEVDVETRKIIDRLTPLIGDMAAGVDADATAFASISQAYKLPKETDREKDARRSAIHDALTAAMKAPDALLADCLRAAELLPRLAAVANPNLLSDVEVAAIMLEAAGRAARVNILVNAGQLPDAKTEKVLAHAELAVEKLGGLLNETLGEAARRKNA